MLPVLHCPPYRRFFSKNLVPAIGPFLLHISVLSVVSNPRIRAEMDRTSRRAAPQKAQRHSRLSPRSACSLPLSSQGDLLRPAQGFHGILQAGCGGPAFRCRDSDQFGWPVGPDIRRPLAGVVDLEAFLNVGRDPGVEAAVGAPEHVDEPRLGKRFWHALRGPDYSTRTILAAGAAVRLPARGRSRMAPTISALFMGDFVNRPMG